ncbi:hypothetical protein ACVW06_000338 [Pantoea ananatis]
MRIKFVFLIAELKLIDTIKNINSLKGNNFNNYAFFTCIYLKKH